MDSAALPVVEDPPSSHAQGKIVEDGYQMITETLNEPLFQLHCEADITPKFFVVFDVFPFAAGAQRLAFRGSIYERRLGARPVFQVHCVVKMEMTTTDYISRGLRDRTRLCNEEAEKTIMKHERAREYVQKWCDLGINKGVYVLSAEKIIITKGCSVSDIDCVTFPVLQYLFKLLSLDAVLYRGAVGTVEDHLSGKFTKFLNNDGQANRSMGANFPSAFAHWTWVASGGDLMVTDIQGVRTGRGYILTDPCVHAVQEGKNYGLSDLGMVGVEEFFKKHECNDLCQDLGLASNGKDLDVGHSMRTRMVRVASEGDTLTNAQRMTANGKKDKTEETAVLGTTRARAMSEAAKPVERIEDKTEELKMSSSRRYNRRGRKDIKLDGDATARKTGSEETRKSKLLGLFRKHVTSKEKG